MGLGVVVRRVVRGDRATRVLQVCRWRDGGGGACCYSRAHEPRDDCWIGEVHASRTFHPTIKNVTFGQSLMIRSV
jgi:hypothetical protein